jgi:lipopolysaccharide export system permease protein
LHFRAADLVKIISRYILREHIGPLVFALSALTSLLLLNYIAKQFGELVGKGLPISAILMFFGLSVPFTFAMTLPMAVLVAVLYAFSRLASENEITALKASGVGMRHLLVPVLMGGAVLTVGMLLFNDHVLPRANHQLATLQRDIARTRPTFALKEQVLNPVQDSRGPGARLYLRAGHIDAGSSRMREVVLYDLSNPMRRRTVIADSGFISFAENRVDLFITLYSGVMQEVPTDNPTQMTRLYFDQERIRIPGVGSEFDRSGIEHGKSDREMTICEMQASFELAERRRQESVRIHAAMAQGTEVAIPMEFPMPGTDGVPRDTTRGGTSGPAVDPYAPPLTLGGMYCTVKSRVAGLFTPSAAEASEAAQDRGGQVVRSSDPAAQERRRSPEEPLPGMVVDTPDTTASVWLPTEQGMGDRPAEAQFTETHLADAQQQIDFARRDANRYLVEIHKKFVLATTCIIFVLIGAPIALRFPRGGVGLVIGVSLAFFGLCYVGLIGGEALADRNIVPPFWAMWAMNIAMTVVGLALTARMGRETGTARGGDLADFMMTMRSGMARFARRFGIPLERRTT